MQFHTKANNQGFTLIELVVVMSLVVLLASSAVPSWQQWLLRSRRHEATTHLMRGLLWVERYRQMHGISPPPEAWPEEMQMTPQGHYRLAWVPQDNGAMALEATPQGQQAQDTCGILVLWETGERAIRPLQQAPASPTHCWAG